MSITGMTLNEFCRDAGEQEREVRKARRVWGLINAEIKAGLRCPLCANRACSVEYGPFECRGERP